MSNSLLPMSDADFWWLRYFMGIAVPIALSVYGIYSILTRHSYAVWGWRSHVQFVPVEGEQAVLMGAAYLGIALALFANCYAQYHEKMGYYYQWLLAAGMLAAGVSVCWCSWIFLIR